MPSWLKYKTKLTKDVIDKYNLINIYKLNIYKLYIVP